MGACFPGYVTQRGLCPVPRKCLWLFLLDLIMRFLIPVISFDTRIPCLLQHSNLLQIRPSRLMVKLDGDKKQIRVTALLPHSGSVAMGPRKITLCLWSCFLIPHLLYVSVSMFFSFVWPFSYLSVQTFLLPRNLSVSPKTAWTMPLTFPSPPVLHNSELHGSIAWH